MNENDFDKLLFDVNEKLNNEGNIDDQNFEKC